MNINPITLLDYTNWANDVVCAGAGQLTESQLNSPIRPDFLSSLGLLVHIMAAERVWLSRWKGESPGRLPNVEDIPTLAALQSAWSPLRVEMYDFVSKTEGSKIMAYHTTQGVEYRMPLWQMVLHVVNHGTEHRSQVALYLAMQEIDLGNLDLIYYLRDHHTK